MESNAMDVDEAASPPPSGNSPNEEPAAAVPVAATLPKKPRSPKKTLVVPLPQREKYALRSATLQKTKEAEERRRLAEFAAQQKKAVKDSFTDILFSFGEMRVE